MKTKTFISFNPLLYYICRKTRIKSESVRKRLHKKGKELGKDCLSHGVEALPNFAFLENIYKQKSKYTNKSNPKTDFQITFNSK